MSIPVKPEPPGGSVSSKPHVMGKALPQRGSGPNQAGLDRGDGQGHCLRNFFAGKAEHISQHQNQPVALRHTGDRLLDKIALRPGFAHGIGILGLSR